MKGEGTSFWPLWWIYHDQWQWMSGRSLWGPSYTFHPGHNHLWMMGFSALDSDQKAWRGQQTYNFELVDEWSPLSNDKNKQFNYRIVGSPKWYFYVEEYWRRVYIQEWEYANNDYDVTSIVGKKGIRWDASLPIHMSHPFREGKDNSMFFTQMCRTLPIEYWLDENKQVRDNYLRYGDGIPADKKFRFNFATDIDIATGDRWMIPNRNPSGDIPSGAPDNWTRQYAYSDKFYISPTIEYQKVVQMNWERLPGYLSRDAEDEETGETFGDGWKLTINLPYTVEGTIKAPFSNSSGVVSPPGTYFNGVVPEANKLHYRTNPPPPYVPNERDPTPEDSGQLYNYAVPNSTWPTDGKWVEQFIGGLIQAKVKVICEDAWGGRFTNWVNSTQFMWSDSFEGKDQNGQR